MATQHTIITFHTFFHSIGYDKNIIYWMMDAVSDCVDKPNYLPQKQLLDIEQAGFDIQNHTKSHPRLSQLRLSDQE